MHPADLLCGFAAPLIALWIRNPDLLPGHATTEVSIHYVLVSSVVTAVALAYFRIGSLFPQFFGSRDAVRILIACGASVLLTTGLIFTFTRLEEIPRSLPALHFFVLAFLLMGWRLIALTFSLRRDRRDINVEPTQVQNIMIVGATRLTWFYIRLVDTFYFGQHRIIAILDPRRGFVGRSILGHNVIGTPAELATLVDEYAVHGVNVSCVVVALQKSEMPQGEASRIEAACEARGIQVRSLPELLSVETLDSPRVETFSPEYQSRIDAIQGRRIWKLKRAVDVVIAALAIIVASPLFVLVALVVLIDGRGPVVFWQQRLGRDGRPIFVYKFRTMRPPLDRHGNLRPDDVRLSPVGKLLRATRLDELPQLFNILMGDMAVTGPRPLLPIDQPAARSVRLAISPGLTGWAQVCGGKLITAEEKAALDEWYIRNTNIALEVKILLQTVIVVLRGDVRNEDAIRVAVADKTEFWREPPVIPSRRHWELPTMDRAAREDADDEASPASSARPEPESSELAAAASGMPADFVTPPLQPPSPAPAAIG